MAVPQNGFIHQFPTGPSQTDHFSPEQEPQTQTEQPFSPALLQEEDDGHLCGKTMLVADWCPYPILPAVAQKCQVSHTTSLLSGYHQLSAPQLGAGDLIYRSTKHFGRQLHQVNQGQFCC